MSTTIWRTPTLPVPCQDEPSCPQPTTLGAFTCSEPALEASCLSLASSPTSGPPQFPIRGDRDWLARRDFRTGIRPTISRPHNLLPGEPSSRSSLSRIFSRELRALLQASRRRAILAFAAASSASASLPSLVQPFTASAHIQSRSRKEATSSSAAEIWQAVRNGTAFSLATLSISSKAIPIRFSTTSNVSSFSVMAPLLA